MTVVSPLIECRYVRGRSSIDCVVLYTGHQEPQLEWRLDVGESSSVNFIDHLELKPTLHSKTGRNGGGAKRMSCLLTAHLTEDLTRAPVTTYAHGEMSCTAGGVGSGSFPINIALTRESAATPKYDTATIEINVDNNGTKPGDHTYAIIIVVIGVCGTSLMSVAILAVRRVKRCFKSKSRLIKHVSSSDVENVQVLFSNDEYGQPNQSGDTYSQLTEDTAADRVNGQITSTALGYTIVG